MLDEYILRGYAIFAICRNCPMTDYCRMTGESCEDVKRIKAIPAANVAEVGYCSECVYHYDDGDHKCKKLRIPCPDDSEFFCKYGKKKEVKRMPNDRKNCPYRHENGNCLPVGGFCTAVSDEYCEETRKKNDFVSRQWLIDEYHRRHEGPPGGALKMIEEALAADVEPVIHCKDCVHSCPEKGHEPDVHCSWWDYPMPPMGFCSKATRKKGEE